MMVAPLHVFSRSCKLLLALVVATFGISGTAHGQALTPPRQYTISPTNVNLLDNTYTTTIEDLSIGTLKLERSYLGGQEVSQGYFGTNWSHNYDMYVRYVYGNGQNPMFQVVLGRTKYVFLGTATQNAPQSDEYGTSLTLVSNVYVFTDRDGTVYRFPNSGATPKIGSITSPDGTVVTVTYSSSKPKLVTSNRGYAIVFDYGSNGAVSAACGFNLTNTFVSTGTTCGSATLKTGYSYSANLLVGATDVIGNVAHYTYASAFGIGCLTDPGTTTCKVTNAYPAGRFNVTSQTMADGTVWQYGCSCSFSGRDDSADPTPDDGSGWTDPTGRTMAFSYHGGTLINYTDGNNFTYSTIFAGRFPYSVESPEHNSVVYGYNARNADAGLTFHAKPGSGLPNITSGIKAYPSACANPITCNEPTTITDGNGNTTAYTYDPTHGGVLTETLPANSAGIQAVTRHAYIQRYAWISNGGGGFAQAASPIWLPSEDRTCRTSATVGGACSAGAADEVVTSYDYGPDSGPNTLLLRGKVVTADGISLRTCFGYDWMGNKISETSPRAGLTSCS